MRTLLLFSLLTPHYGILTSSDFAWDTDAYEPRPYSPNGLGAFWQCFPTQFVTAGYGTSRGADPMGRSDISVTMCDLEIRFRGPGIWSDYWDRRGRPLSFCKEFIKNWRALTQAEPHVCLHGEPSGLVEARIQGRNHPIRGWVWNKFKTRKGCYGAFSSSCSP